MKKRHQKLAQRLTALMKCEPDYREIDEITIINDGGGTGTWVVQIQKHKRAPGVCRITIEAPECKPEVVTGKEEYTVIQI